MTSTGTDLHDMVKAIDMLRLMAALIKEKGSMPSGELYALVMNSLSLQQYEGALKILKDNKIIKVENNLLTFIPEEPKK